MFAHNVAKNIQNPQISFTIGVLATSVIRSVSKMEITQKIVITD